MITLMVDRLKLSSGMSLHPKDMIVGVAWISLVARSSRRRIGELIILCWTTAAKVLLQRFLLWTQLAVI
jgi:hypothetical protein